MKDYPPIHKITIINVEWNCYNGLTLSILDVEVGRLDSCFLGVHIGWKSYFIIYILFIPIEIKKPWY